MYTHAGTHTFLLFISTRMITYKHCTIDSVDFYFVSQKL